jgi:hypothetical protein
MKLYRAYHDGMIVRLSPEPIEPNHLPFPCVIDEVERPVPAVDGRIEQWEGDDGLLYPHLHFICPRCGREHNVDLYPDDLNPRFATCDSCGWDSVVWIHWSKQ